MPAEVKVPSFGDSILEVTIGQWLKQVGDTVKVDEDLVEVESEKSSMAIPSPISGVLTEIIAQNGETVAVGAIVARVGDAPAGGGSAPAAAAPAAAPSPSPTANFPSGNGDPRIMPAAARVMAEQGLKAGDVTGTGPGDRVLKEDAQKAADSRSSAPVAAPPVPVVKPPVPAPTTTLDAGLVTSTAGARAKRRQALTTIRKRIAQRLVEAQHTAALLTTFNEVDMSNVMSLRKEFQDKFVERHGLKLGFMSFFVKATVAALQAYPAINAQIEGNDVIYHDYVDMGIAVGGGKGLVVPILRSVEKMSFAEIEGNIGKLAKKAMENALKPADLEGGTFTISNGGVYGSLLSTPIVNPPQSGVLGMHSIQDRPVVRDGQIVARPMMYLALTYDHRIVDGKEAVSFLKRIKDSVENPMRLMLDL